MPQEYPELGVVSMSVDMAAQDCEYLAQSLASVRIGLNMPMYVRTECVLPDGRQLLLASTIQHAKTETGHTLKVKRSIFSKDDLYPRWLSEDRDQQTALEILVKSNVAGACTLTARAETWCADVLFYILLEASDDRFLLDAVRAELPAVGELSWLAFWQTSFHEVTIYPNADYRTVTEWVMLRLANLSRYESYSDDGIGQILTGIDPEVVLGGCVIKVLCRLVSKPDVRGIRAAIRCDPMITFRLEALGVDRCRVKARVKAEPFSRCYFDVLANFAHDFPVTRAALVAANVPIKAISVSQDLVGSDDEVPTERSVPTAKPKMNPAQRGSPGKPRYDADEWARREVAGGTPKAAIRQEWQQRRSDEMSRLGRGEPADWQDSFHKVFNLARLPEDTEDK